MSGITRSICRPICRSICRPIPGAGSAPEPIWTPAALFAQGQQGVWYDPADISTLFQDAAQTVPVTTNAQPVRVMLDKSGNQNHAIADNDAARPLYRADGTISWLQFDGVNNSLSAQFGQTYSQPVSLLASGQTDIDEKIMNFMDGATTNVMRISLGTMHITKLYRTWAGTVLSGTAPSVSTNAHVLSGIADGASSVLRHNGSVIATGNAGSHGWEGVRVGSDNNADGQLLQGRLYGAIGIQERLSESNLIAAENYLSNNAGVQV